MVSASASPLNGVGCIKNLMRRGVAMSVTAQKILSREVVY
jgi:hypothetical protein